MNNLEPGLLCYIIKDRYNNEGDLEFYTELVLILKVTNKKYTIMDRKWKIYDVVGSILFENEDDAIKRCDMLANGL